MDAHDYETERWSLTHALQDAVDARSGGFHMWIRVFAAYKRMFGESLSFHLDTGTPI